MIRNFSSIAPRILLLSAVLPLAACGADMHNRSVESVHQPVVTTTTFAYDVTPNSNGSLGDAEKSRLSGWLSSLDAGYGDHVSIASTDGAIAYTLQRDIADVLGQRGMALRSTDAAAATIVLPAGTVRLTLRRASASVPGCPDWSHKQEGSMFGSASSNYGCGVNSNLAAMVADPQDLVRGRSSDSTLEGATATRAIKSWQETEPTGKGGLKELSAGGNR